MYTLNLILIGRWSNLREFIQKSAWMCQWLNQFSRVVTPNQLTAIPDFGDRPLLICLAANIPRLHVIRSVCVIFFFVMDSNSKIETHADSMVNSFASFIRSGDWSIGVRVVLWNQELHHIAVILDRGLPLVKIEMSADCCYFELSACSRNSAAGYIRDYRSFYNRTRSILGTMVKSDCRVPKTDSEEFDLTFPQCAAWW